MPNYDEFLDEVIELLNQPLDYILPDPAEELMKKDLSRVIFEVMDTLTPRERKVLIYRFGLGGHDEYTMDKVGEMFAVTRERIRQIEAKALRKMRQPFRAEMLSTVSDSIDFVLTKQQRENYNRIEEAKKAQQARKSSKREIQKWVRPRKKIDEDEVRIIVIGKDGWVDGRVFTPNLPGIYERISFGFMAYSKWNGKKWLIGSEDYDGAKMASSKDISSHQMLKWREVVKS